MGSVSYFWTRHTKWLNLGVRIHCRFTLLTNVFLKVRRPTHIALDLSRCATISWHR